MKAIIYLIIVLLLCTSVFGLGITYTPARMTLRTDIPVNFGSVLQGALRLTNPNPSSVNVTLSSSNPNMFFFQNNGFVIGVNETKIVTFDIYVSAPGEANEVVYVTIVDKNGLSAGASSAVRIITTLNYSANSTRYPVMLEVSKKDNEKSIYLFNPYQSLIMTVSLTTGNALNAEIAPSSFILEPNSTQEIKVNVKGIKKGDNYIYTNVTTDYYNSIIQTKVSYAKGSSTMLIGLIIIAAAIIIGAGVYILSGKKKK